MLGRESGLGKQGSSKGTDIEPKSQEILSGPGGWAGSPQLRLGGPGEWEGPAGEEPSGGEWRGPLLEWGDGRGNVFLVSSENPFR